jgi:hypothetical protein
MLRTTISIGSCELDGGGETISTNFGDGAAFFARGCFDAAVVGGTFGFRTLRSDFLFWLKASPVLRIQFRR